VLIYVHEAGGWQRCRVEAKLSAKRFDKASGDQDLLVCWTAGGGKTGGLPVLSLEHYLKETPYPGGPALLDYLPELAVRLASNVLPIKSGRRP